MKFIYKMEMESTQLFLKEQNKEMLVIAKEQAKGIGSRGNKWEKVECGLYFSFSLNLKLLPKDLLIQSTSIYFGVLFLELFRKFNSNIWLKWPNDFYIENQKIGGIVSNVKTHFLIVGIGLNILDSTFASMNQEKKEKEKIGEKQKEKIYTDVVKCILDKFGFHFEFNVDREIEIDLDLKWDFKNITWMQIFEIYKNEFHKNYGFKFHFQDKLIDFKDFNLENDGSIRNHKKKFYSNR